MKTALWWGRTDRTYSRNRILLTAFSDLGWCVEYFHPASSRLGLVESYVRRLRRPDLIWVPCFRHTDISSAAHWARKWDVPMIIDPLISAYEKDVWERTRFPQESLRGRRRRNWEARLFSSADRVIADTPAHLLYFEKEFNLTREYFSIIYVGAEDAVFRPMPVMTAEDRFEILFYGSFLPLQGADVIIEAAQMTRKEDIRWTLLGAGDLKDDIRRRAEGFRNIRFEPWIAYDQLPYRMAKADILLGVFGTTPKADLVIPNKVYQAMAVGRPIITRRATAYAATIAETDVIGWVPAGDPEALALIVKKWFRKPLALATRGHETRRLYERFFSKRRIAGMLKSALEMALDR
jgi:glycosyltransferase involved in cell wall biosynthesis